MVKMIIFHTPMVDLNSVLTTKALEFYFRKFRSYFVDFKNLIFSLIVFFVLLLFCCLEKKNFLILIDLRIQNNTTNRKANTLIKKLILDYLIQFIFFKQI